MDTYLDRGLSYLQLLNNGGIACVVRTVNWYIPLSFKDDVRNAPLGKGLNRPLVITLIDHILARSFNFVNHSLDHLAEERRWKIDIIVDLTPCQDW